MLGYEIFEHLLVPETLGGSPVPIARSCGWSACRAPRIDRPSSRPAGVAVFAAASARCRGSIGRSSALAIVSIRDVGMEQSVRSIDFAQLESKFNPPLVNHLRRGF